MSGSNSGLVLKGGDSLLKRLAKARGPSPQVLHDATQEALQFIESKAKEVLDQEIYSHADTQGNPSDSDSLYQSFAQELSSVARFKVQGKLSNTSDHAIFLEDGTDDEGTGSHFVPVVKGKALHWMNAATGASVYSKGHEVKGITPIRFMHRALTEHKPEVLAIYRKHFKGIWS